MQARGSVRAGDLLPSCWKAVSFYGFFSCASWQIVVIYIKKFASLYIEVEEVAEVEVPEMVVEDAEAR